MSGKPYGKELPRAPRPGRLRFGLPLLLARVCHDGAIITPRRCQKGWLAPPPAIAEKPAHRISLRAARANKLWYEVICSIAGSDPGREMLVHLHAERSWHREGLLNHLEQIDGVLLPRRSHCFEKNG